jgi:hypothetical protein
LHDIHEEDKAMKGTPAAISLAGSQLRETRHICAFFNNDEEEYRILLPFIKDGLKSGDKAVHVLNPEQRQDHLQRLTGAGIDPGAVHHLGQFGGDAVIDIMRTHPMVIIGGILQRRARRGNSRAVA